MPPRVRPGRTHGRSNTPRHEIQAGADLSPRQPALRRSHKFTALTEFCKRLCSENLFITEFVAELRDEMQSAIILHGSELRWNHRSALRDVGNYKRTWADERIVANGYGS